MALIHPNPAFTRGITCGRVLHTERVFLRKKGTLGAGSDVSPIPLQQNHACRASGRHLGRIRMAWLPRLTGPWAMISRSSCFWVIKMSRLLVSTSDDDRIRATDAWAPVGFTTFSMDRPVEVPSRDRISYPS